MTTTNSTQATAAAGSKDQAVSPAAKKALRHKKKAAGRKKRVLKLKTDKEFAKKYFEGRSKRSTDKKSAFRKKKTKKK